MKSIAELEKRIQCLELENQYLKKLLTDAGIFCSAKEIGDGYNEYDPNQGARIIPRNITETDNGILNAATAFGKTVVCCNVIAKKQVSTLILLQSSALMEQWREALEKFLSIDEELPEYETPTGRKKKRKSLIGKFIPFNFIYFAVILTVII